MRSSLKSFSGRDSMHGCLKAAASSYLIEVHKGNGEQGVYLADVFGKSVENSSYRAEQSMRSHHQTDV